MKWLLIIFGGLAVVLGLAFWIKTRPLTMLERLEVELVCSNPSDNQKWPCWYALNVGRTPMDMPQLQLQTQTQETCAVGSHYVGNHNCCQNGYNLGIDDRCHKPTD